MCVWGGFISLCICVCGGGDEGQVPTLTGLVGRVTLVVVVVVVRVGVMGRRRVRRWLAPGTDAHFPSPFPARRRGGVLFASVRVRINAVW